MNKKKKLIFIFINFAFIRFILYGYQYKKQVYVKENNQIRTGQVLVCCLKQK